MYARSVCMYFFRAEHISVCVRQQHLLFGGWSVLPQTIGHTKQIFKGRQNDLCMLCCRGGRKEEDIWKKPRVQVCCTRKPFCPEPLASHRTSVIRPFLSKRVGFCLSLILRRNICYRALLLFLPVKYLTEKKLHGPVCVSNVSLVKIAAVSTTCLCNIVNTCPG